MQIHLQILTVQILCNKDRFHHLQPRVRQGLPDAHPLLRLVHQEVRHEVLGLAGDVLPQLEVEVDVAHLDTLQGLAVVLRKRRHFFSLSRFEMNRFF